MERDAAGIATIAEDALLDRQGRPLRGAARAARVRKLQRERVALAGEPAPAVTLPASPPRPPLTAAQVAPVKLPSLPVRWVRIMALATAMTMVFATVIGTSGLIAQRGTIAFGASTTLTIIRGDVAVQTPDAVTFRGAVDGDLLVAGTTVRTGDDAYAVITYFEGSTVSLDPSTTLVIQALSFGPDGSTTIEMQQPAGRTWHSVQRLLTGDSKYELRTPSATAAVRGTAFAVQVVIAPSGETVTVVQTTEGAVATRKAPEPGQPEPVEEVVVREGFRATVVPSAPLPEPEPAPEPERTVTVSLATNAGLVVDSLGRANGIRDGRVVLQTPGASVGLEDGQLVVRLPDIPDGRVAAVLDRTAGVTEVEVVTEVVERGASAERVVERVTTGRAVAATAVELRRGGTESQIETAAMSGQEIREIAAKARPAESEREAGPGTRLLPAATVPPLPVVERAGPAVAAPPAAAPPAAAPPASEGEQSGQGRAPGFLPVGRLPSLPPFGQPDRVLPPQAQEQTPSEPPRGPGAAPDDRTPPPARTPEPERTSEPARTEPPRPPAEPPAPPSEPPAPPSEPPAPQSASTGPRGFVPAASLRPLPFGAQPAPPAPPRGRP